MSAGDSFEVDIQRQSDLRYRWSLRRLGRVVDEGVELYVASCLRASTVGLDPTSQVTVSVDGFLGGSFFAVRMQLESSAVALELAQAMLNRRP